MKKLLFIISCVFIICACTKQESIYITESACKIGKYDCWDIIQDINKHKVFYSKEKNKYYNPDLEKKGISITSVSSLLDGGSVYYTLSNQAEIFIDHNSESQNWDYTTITDLFNKKQVTYDTKGNIVSFKELK